jgi:tetratricopeptide (TPR) repeat protein
VHSTRWKYRRPSGRRGVAVAVIAALSVSLLGAQSSFAMPKPTPPTRPSAPTPPQVQVTQGQVDQARGEKDALAAAVGQLSGEIAAAKIQLQQLQGRAELAEQKYTLALTQWHDAQAAADRAQQAVQDARQAVARAHVRFVEYVQAIYTSGGVDGTAGSLLTAQDPSVLLQQSSLEAYQQQNKADAIGAMETASVAKSNADAAAKRAEAAAQRAKAKADTERKAAEAAVVAEQQQKAQLEDTMASKQIELNQKQAELDRLNYGRAQTVAYLNRLGEYHRAMGRYDSALNRYNSALRQYQAWLREKARERAARHHHHHQHSGSGGGVPCCTGGGGPPPPSNGNWTAAKGRTAAHRALSELGLPYAWAGGNAYGPTRGVCVSGDAWNDCNKIGFDCSGLAMYAWGASWWAHYAASQYFQAGSYHPSASNLLPGDLIFWSSNGAASGIHHVAIYIGGGQMVEAPYSGAYVQISSIWEYGGFFGATRPLT